MAILPNLALLIQGTASPRSLRSVSSLATLAAGRSSLVPPARIQVKVPNHLVLRLTLRGMWCDLLAFRCRELCSQLLDRLARNIRPQGWDIYSNPAKVWNAPLNLPESQNP